MHLVIGLLILAQNDPAPATDAAGTAASTAPPAEPAWWEPIVEGLTASPFLLLILFIFVTAIITVIFQQRKRDKCLKLLNKYHVSYLTTEGKAIWGDLVVYSQGVELEFDAPYRTSRGLLKTSQMIFEPAMTTCLALCRTIDGLTPQEKKQRARQLRRCVRPNIIWRSWRWIRNAFNTLRDAFNNAFNQIVGQIAKAKPGSVIASQQGQVSTIGTTLLGSVANAYEPILEKHIGKPVLLEIACPAAPDQPKFELPGYLAEYSDKYLAVFNTDHEPAREIELTLDADHEDKGFKVQVLPDFVVLTCTGPEVMAVKSLKTGDRAYDLNIGVTNGCSVRLRRRDNGEAVVVKLELTRRIDIVCPRSQASVHFGGASVQPTGAETQAPVEDTSAGQQLGLSPEAETEAKDGEAAIEPPSPGAQAGTPGQ